MATRWDKTEKGKAYHDNYYAQNREKYLQKAKEYRDGHKEERRAYRRKYYAEHKDEFKAWYQEHKEEHKAHMRDYYRKRKARAQNGTPQFKEYPIGSIEDWEEWDGEACVNLAAEVAREWANKYRNACFGYKKHKNLEHLQGVERQMKLTPMAILVNVGDVCEQIRHEFKIYDLDDEQTSGKEQE